MNKMTVQELQERILQIKPLDEKAMEEAKVRQDALAKPPGSLGLLEDISIQMAGITGSVKNEIKKHCVVVMCADNGVVEENIASAPQSVTLAQTINFTRRLTGVGALAESFDSDLLIVDVGINGKVPEGLYTEEPFSDTHKIVNRRIADGTKNLAKEDAMSREQVLRAIEIGLEMAEAVKAGGYSVFGIGEMGIGNTTTSAAMAAAMLRCDVATVTGRGAGLNDSGLEKKIRVIESAIEKYDLYNKDTFEILMTVGGLDIAGLVGVCIGGALYHIPVVLDGVISMVSALAAERLLSGVTDFIIPSHGGREPAVALLCEALSVRPVIRASLALGEGTGAVMMFALLDMALSVYKGRTTFDDISISQYERYV